VRHSTTAAYYRLRQYYHSRTCHSASLGPVTTLVPPETFDNAFSYKKVTNFLPENGPPALLRVVEEGATFPVILPNSKVEVRWSLAFFPWVLLGSFEFALHFSPKYKYSGSSSMTTNH